MRYQNVCIEALGYVVPSQVVSSDEIEEWLTPVYSRLKLPRGRLELMSGIRERRFWEPGALPSQKSSQAAARAMEIAGIAPEEIGAIVHASVCRDVLEPATACLVHERLKLSRRCHAYDVSNACLGLMNGVLQVANLIELGQIRAGLVVGTESSRPLVEATITQLNADHNLSRGAIKTAMASLTIGSGSAAIVLAHRSLSRTGNRLLGGVVQIDSEQVGLCQGTHDDAIAHGMRPLMQTDAERLMHAGLQVASDTYGRFLKELGWGEDGPQKTICHQVGGTHRRLMLETLGLDENNDFATFATFGNTGSVALPLTAALAIEQGHILPKDQVAWLGIGSGLNVIMLGVDWQTTLVARPGAASPRTSTRKMAPAAGS